MLTPEQRAARRSHIGASDVPAILGLDPFRTAGDVYWSKVAEIPDATSASMDLGNRLEAIICDWAAERLDVQIERNVTVAAADGIITANLDARVLGRPEAIEAKFTTLADEWGDEGTDQIPDRVIVQCNVQAYAGTLDRVWVPGFIVGPRSAELRMYCVPRSDELIGQIVPRVTEFWHQYVLTGTPPEGFTVPPLAVLKARRREPNSLVALDDGALDAWLALETAKATSKAAVEEEERCKALVLAALGDAEGGRLPDGRLITYLEQKSAPRMDYARFRALHADLYNELVTQGSHRVLRIKKGGK